MRPVDRGDNPRNEEFENYRDAFPDLVSRIGMYCSYCERPIKTQLAVEHIQPKGLEQYKHLQGRWDNFLLGCVNCNSTKGDKNVILSETLLPDRDNTATAFVYSQDGKITISPELNDEQKTFTNNLLSLTGLDKRINQISDSNGQLVAIDRVAQRLEAWAIAEMSLEDLQSNPNGGFRRQIVRTAVESGFFSIWMAVFERDLTIRRMLIEGFRGTAIDCFDRETMAPISPRPMNALEGAGKV